MIVTKLLKPADFPWVPLGQTIIAAAGATS